MSGQGTQWVRDEGWVGPGQVCSFVTDPGSTKYFEPPEICGMDTEPGSEFCTIHTDDPETHEDPEDLDEEATYGSFGECYDFYTGDSRG